MALGEIVPGVFGVPRTVANAYLLDGGDGLVLVDTGMPRRADTILRHVDAVGRVTGRDLRSILLTHAHLDHAGSLAELAAKVDVPVVVGVLDALVVEAGGIPPRPKPTGPLGALMVPFAVRMPIPPARVDRQIHDGDGVPGAPALRAIQTPGHTPGHMSFLWPERGGVLFAGDVAVNYFGLREAFVVDDRTEARATLARLATLDFEVALLGHGRPIRGRASARFRRLVERMAR
jgi:glyoxylase-like metal-dependent hydrolase (beta-lactamase superfamily II)